MSNDKPARTYGTASMWAAFNAGLLLGGAVMWLLAYGNLTSEQAAQISDVVQEAVQEAAQEPEAAPTPTTPAEPEAPPAAPVESEAGDSGAGG